MAIYANITIDQGSDFTSTIDVEDTTGNPANLSGYNARAQLRKTYGSVTAYDFVATITNPGGGQINIEMSSAVTNGLKPGRYVYDVEVVSSGGTVTRVVEGQVEVTPGVTRS